MRYKIILLFIIFVKISFGQEIKVVRICDITDSVANVKFATDINGNICSVLKVSTPSIKNLTFSGMIIGNVEELKDGCYLLNIPEKTKHINFCHEDYLPGIIDFSDYNIAVKGRKVYHVIMESEKHKAEVAQKGTLQYLIFKYKVPIKSLVVNGTQWNVSENQSKKMVCSGHYEYTVQTKDNRVVEGEVDVKDSGISKVVNIKF